MSDSGPIALLREDPELGHGISSADWRDAERLVTVPGYLAPVGPWNLASDHEPCLGVLVLDGLVTTNVVLGERVATQLAGPGDVIHTARPDDSFVPTTVALYVSEPARLAILDRRFISAVRRWPALLLALHERLRCQEHRLSIHAAIGKLRRIEDRVLAILWHLADRFGRVTAEGVVVPLALTHETLGRLCGAERPTVSLALTELGERGDVQRRSDGAFVLRPGSWELLVPNHGDRPQLRGLQITRTSDAGLESPRFLDVDGRRARLSALDDELSDAASTG